MPGTLVAFVAGSFIGTIPFLSLSPSLPYFRLPSLAVSLSLSLSLERTIAKNDLCDATIK